MAYKRISLCSFLFLVLTIPYVHSLMPAQYDRWNKAFEIINLAETQLDDLLFQHSFKTKRRESLKDADAEILKYWKNNIELRITACLHPYDYPYSLSADFFKMDGDKGTRCKSFRQLLQSANTTSTDLGLPIATDDQVKTTIHTLRDGITKILENKLFELIK